MFSLSSADIAAILVRNKYMTLDLLLTRLSTICACWIEDPENDETHTTFIFGFRLWKMNLKILFFGKSFHVAYLLERLMLNHGMDLMLEIRTYWSLLPIIRKKRDAFFLLMLSQLTRDCLRADHIPIPCLVGNFLPIPCLVRNFLRRYFSY
jgi:hypothetical protein